MDIPDEVLDRLYSAPVDRFTATRNELADELKKEGDGDLAARVKKLRKPGLPLWTLNRLGRARPELVEKLLTAAADLRDAIERGDGGAIRDGNAQRRKALADLLDAAKEELTAVDHASSRDLIERVSRGLLAASADESIAEELSTGRLTEEPSADEVGWGLVGADLPDPDETPAAQGRKVELTEAAEEAQRKAADAAAEAQALEREADKLEKAGVRARSRADDARRAAERHERTAEEALARLKDA
jgi:hypothetical protein